MSGRTIDEFLEVYRLALEKSARLSAELHRLEEQRKSVLAQIIISLEGAIALREHHARADARYLEFLERLFQAEEAANLAQATCKWMDVRFEMWRSRNALRRAEMVLK